MLGPGLMEAPGRGGVLRAALVRLAESPAAVTAFWRLAFSVACLVPILLYRGDWREW